MSSRIRSKQAISNDELRGFAKATFAEEPSRLRSVLMILAILVPAGSVYAWRTGMIQSSMPSMPGRLSMLPTIFLSAPTPAAAPRSVSVDTSSKAKEIAKAPTPPTQTRAPGFAALPIAAKAPVVAPNAPAARPINPDDIAAVCSQMANSVPSGRQPPLAVDREAGHLLCLMARKPERLCAAGDRDYLLKRFKSYADAMSGGIGELSDRTVSMGQDRFQSGIHKQVRDEMKKLAGRGLLKVADFGWFAPDFVKVAIGDVRVTQSACVKKAETPVVEPLRPALRGVTNP